MCVCVCACTYAHMSVSISIRFSYWYCTFLNMKFVHGFVPPFSFPPTTTYIRITNDIRVPFDYVTVLGTQTPAPWPQQIWPSTDKNSAQWRVLSWRVSAWTSQSLSLRDFVLRYSNRIRRGSGVKRLKKRKQWAKAKRQFHSWVSIKHVIKKSI